MKVYNPRLKQAWYRMRQATARSTGISYAHEYLTSREPNSKTYGILTSFTVTEARVAGADSDAVVDAMLYTFVSPDGETRVGIEEYTAAHDDFLEAVTHQEQHRITGDYVTLVEAELDDEDCYQPVWDGTCRCPISTEASLPEGYGTTPTDGVEAHGSSSDGSETVRGAACDEETGRGAAFKG